MGTIRGDDKRLRWHGLAERAPIPGTNGAVAAKRLRSADAAFQDPALLVVADIAAGVRLSLRTNSPTVSMKLAVLVQPGRGPLRSADGPARIDLSMNGTVVDTACVGADGTVDLETHASGMADIELWLPHRCPVAVEQLVLADGAAIEVCHLDRPAWIAHGSSITQSRFSDGPSTSWTSQVAQTLGLDLYNLGFAGECHLEPLVARMIASMPADVISICAGINSHTSNSMSERVYRANLAGFVKIIRDGHPSTPIVLTSPIGSPKRESTPSHPRLLPTFARRLLSSQTGSLPVGSVGPTLAELRRATHEVAAALVADGDENLHRVDGLALLSTSDAEHLVDGLHPGQKGEDLIADRYTALMRPVLEGS